MHFGLHISFYSGTLICSALVALLLGSRAWLGTKKDLSRSFALFESAIFVWSLFRFIQFVIPSPEGQFEALRLQFLGIAFIPGFIFLFACAISNRPARSLGLALIFSLGFLFFVLVETNDLHHFVWAEDAALSLPVNPKVEWGYWLFVVYACIHVIAAFVIMIQTALRARGITAKWIWEIIMCLAIPLVINSVFHIFFFGNTMYDATPIAFAVSGALIARTLSQFDFLDAMPYAKDVVLESIGTPLIVVDALGIVIGANEEAKTIFPDRKAIEGRDIAELFPVLSGVGVDGNKRRWSFEEKDYLISCYSVKRGPKLWRGRIYMFRDITDLMRAQRESEEARAQADAANAAKSAFVAAVSHELRNPLNAIISLADLDLHSDPPPAIREDLEVMLSSGNIILGLVNDLLDLSKIEAGKMELEGIDFDLREKVISILRAFRPVVEKKGIFLDINVEESLPSMVHGDPLRYGQVLMNLVSNAVKFTEHGAITVDISLVPLPAEAASAGPDPRSVCVLASVGDTGMGINADKMPLLFHEFSQIDSSVSRRFGGTGLGLSICKKLVALFGGSIEVSSIEGQGSVFSFTARFEPSTVPEVALKPVTAIEDRALRILVVDDDPINTAVATRYIEKLGYAAVSVGTGNAAIEAASSDSFDIVLLDLGLADMDGFEACRRIRMETAARPQGELPVAAMTARAEAGVRGSCAAAGMVGLLAKPIDPSALDDLLSRVAAKKRDLGPRAAAVVPAENLPTAAGALAQVSPGAPIVDVPALLDRLDGDEAFMRELLRIFVDEAPSRKEAFEKASRARDLEALQKQGHSLKGSALSLCANPVGVAAGAIEAACISSRKPGFDIDLVFPPIAAKLEELEGLIDATTEAAKAIVGTK
jgi:signal transduction histidine kinase/CheY-like chemotaxis protein/HPt (histidine-containing phosphotransfer) domain-containing protein